MDTTDRLPDGQLQRAEILSALSHALDLTEGQPAGHCVRCCWLGMQLGHALHLGQSELQELYYTLLLKDLGCSSNAARITRLYATDDHAFKRGFKQVDDSVTRIMPFLLRHTGLGQPLGRRLASIVDAVRHGGEHMHELIQTRCERGSAIARELRFPEGVAAGIYSLDEHYDGHGQPHGTAGDHIPLASRIALLAQVADVFHTTHDGTVALEELQNRKGSWFDPALVDAFSSIATGEAFWTTLESPDLTARVWALEPCPAAMPMDEDYLDSIASAFAQVVDAKSPYTAGHSERVTEYTRLTAERLGLPAHRRRWLERGALLHDIGKLGVSNAILDKPGKPTRAEWESIKRHPLHTYRILTRIGGMDDFARMAAAHHERLDGHGYPWGLKADAISRETRILTTADIFDALTADRPYRGPMPRDRALSIMHGEAGKAIDPECLEALEQALPDE